MADYVVEVTSKLGPARVKELLDAVTDVDVVAIYEEQTEARIDEGEDLDVIHYEIRPKAYIG